jgi:endonuclease/exonuclease/phosphatase family metal-dependent hydrolase
MRLRIATFNLESLGEEDLARRLAALGRPLAALRADILCLQEINAEKIAGRRRLSALVALLDGTPYRDYATVSTLTADGDPADVHNLAIASRLPIRSHRQLRHDLVERPAYRLATAVPPAAAAAPIEWERPILAAEIALGGGRMLNVLNMHLRAPLAAPVAGQKLGPYAWRTASGWAEGFFVAAVKRAGQALEARIAIDRLLDADPDALVVAAGDLNADLYEMPLRILRADPGDTGNPALAGRALFPAEASVEEGRRFTVLHAGRRLVLDHLLLSAALRRRLVGADILNDGLADEAGPAAAARGGSFHAPLVAEFDIEN